MIKNIIRNTKFLQIFIASDLVARNSLLMKTTPVPRTSPYQELKVCNAIFTSTLLKTPASR